MAMQGEEFTAGFREPYAFGFSHMRDIVATTVVRVNRLLTTIDTTKEVGTVKEDAYVLQVLGQHLSACPFYS
jgi:uncharacterized protein YqiB (DUF1249 family)